MLTARIAAALVVLSLPAPLIAACGTETPPDGLSARRPVETLLFRAGAPDPGQQGAAPGILERAIRDRGLPVPELLGASAPDDRAAYVTAVSRTRVVVEYLPLEDFSPGPTSPRYRIAISFSPNLVCSWKRSEAWQATTDDNGRFVTPWFRGQVSADGRPISRRVRVGDARGSDETTGRPGAGNQARCASRLAERSG